MRRRGGKHTAEATYRGGILDGGEVAVYPTFEDIRTGKKMASAGWLRASQAEGRNNLPVVVARRASLLENTPQRAPGMSRPAHSSFWTDAFAAIYWTNRKEFRTNGIETVPALSRPIASRIERVRPVHGPEILDGEGYSILCGLRYWRTTLRRKHSVQLQALVMHADSA
ncbi:hypothetical protein [Amycolatopsis dendrobii]|uniref:Uncharacterized protein n=1 Tax=Amycolatopsis dendrobii TaxID=2760662 RepID=A0A7W3ZFU4_9PSEU|nr:hypothetical protein [Amycolatopsis dendrobii]MBB1159840.1 hypothetical protein [Amycolatopsis dendrobii]